MHTFDDSRVDTKLNYSVTHFLNVCLFLLLLVFICIYIMWCDLRYVAHYCIGSVSDCIMHFVVTVKIRMKWAPMETDQSALKDVIC